MSQAEYLFQNNGPSTNQATTVLPFLAEFYVESYLQSSDREEDTTISEKKFEPQNFESQNFESQNFESQNFDSQNFESQNFESPHFESKKFEPQNISLLNHTKSQNSLRILNNASPTAAKLEYPRESLISSTNRSQISSHTLIASNTKISDSGYPSFNDVQKANTVTVKTSVDSANNTVAVKNGIQNKNYKSGGNTNFMKQLNEMDGFDANFTEFKIYGENQPGIENENHFENKRFNANQESGDHHFPGNKSWKSPQFNAPTPSSNNTNYSNRKSSNSNQSDPYSDNMESPFGITVNSNQKPSSSPKNNNSDDTNCGIM